MHDDLLLAISISEQYKDRSLELARQLSCPACSNSKTENNLQDCSSFDYVLQFEHHNNVDAPILALAECHSKLGGSIYVDFVGGKMDHRRRFGGGRGQPIARAMGLKNGANPIIVDATAGLGRDAFVLASLGAQVTLLERSPILAALLQDGLNRASMDKDIAPITNERMKLINKNAIEWLKNRPADQKPDVVYMDPMYPHRNKSALVKKEMRYLREIVGDDDDASQLLHAALSCARHRVVVKRPRNAPIVTGRILNGRVPSTAIESKNTRYDVYII